MEHNEALALKYRPMDFDELVGQESVSRTLSLALESKRLSHAYLFSGLRGSGKTSSARIFARALQCEKGPKAKPCGMCANCLAANPHKMRHIDIIELDGASSRKIDDIRELIEQTKYHPNMGRFKIFIIDEVHMLTKEAFNALLKTLEEPPEYVKFILATTDPLKLPATILSRTQHFRFKRISEKNIFGHLKKILHQENIPYQDEALSMLIRSGSGSLRDTLTLLDQVIIYSHYNITADSCASMLGLINPQSLNILFEEIFKQDKAALLKHIEGFSEYECEMLLDEMAIFLKEKLFYADDSRYNAMIIDRFFRIITQAKELLSLGSDDGFVLTLSIFKMLEALKIQEIDRAIEILEQGVVLPSQRAQERESHHRENKDKESEDDLVGVDLGVQILENTQGRFKNEVTQSPANPKNPASFASPSPTHSANLTQSNASFNQMPSGADLFALLVQKIFERNFELGEIFERNIRFVSYENGVLVWESAAQDADKERLKNSYANVIKGFVLEIFGMQTQIKPIAKEVKESPKNQGAVQNITREAQNVGAPNHTDFNPPQSKALSDTKLQNQPILESKPSQTQELQQSQPMQKSIQEEVNEALELPILQEARRLLEVKQIKVRPKAENQ